MNSSKSSTTTVQPKAEEEDLEKGNNDAAARVALGGKDREGEKELEKVSKDENKEKKLKNKWTIFDPFNLHPVTPPPASLDDAKEIPLATASFLSELTFWWMNPLLVLGYKRTLVAEDLWKMDPSRQSGYLADQFEMHFERRRMEVEAWNKALEDGTMNPSAARKLWWKVRHRISGFGSPDGKREIGIAMALSDTFGLRFWSAGIFKITGDVALVCSPLLTKQIIYFVTDASNSRKGIAGYSDPSVGKGVGLAIGLFILQIIASLCTAQTFSRSGQVGILARGALIAAVYRRAMVLSGRARVKISNSKLVNHISTDISRIDFASSFFHFGYTCIFQLIEVIVILLINLGVSSLAGIALVAVAMPFQTYAMRKLFMLRRKSMVFTDARIKLISELLLGIRVIKLFAWESPYLQKVHNFRKRELVGIRNLLTIRAANQALALSIPLLSSVVVFVTYSLTGHTQNPAIIWTSLSLLNLLRMPLMMLPNSLNTSTDAYNALGRLISVFTAETLDETFLVDFEAKDALVVEKADFVWETSIKPESDAEKGKAKKGKAKKEVKVDAALDDKPPSSLHGIDFIVPRGELWVLCGPVGSGKSSLLQGLIGEMRKTSGEVKFGGSVSYCAQTPWIQNTTVRENILFGQPFDEERYWRCVRDSCLLPDLEMLPHGDMTEIGEKGIALSGGQRQRVSICRTLYYNADIVLFDDPLSALDAHVGQYIMDHVVLGALAGKTRILATHALHFMSSADKIICMDNCAVVEQGTYAELIEKDGTFARLAREFGGKRDREAADLVMREKKIDVSKAEEEKDGEPKQRSGLMQAEERATGAVSRKVYLDYLKAAKGFITVPLVILTMILMQAGTLLSQFDLTWWQENKWNRGADAEGFYMGLYAAFGVSSTLFTFFMGVLTVNTGVTASKTLHREAINKVLRAPMSMFDTTPIGRILNRFAKDSIDNRLNDSSRMALAMFAQIAGSFVLIAIVDQWFIIAVGGVFFSYWALSGFYRESAREIKRLDNLLRSGLYAHFSESLAGLATVRAFRETERFKKDNENFIDIENRAYYLTVINQRWLAIRLDLIGSLLTLFVALLSVGQRYSINSSKIGLILASVLSIQQGFSMVIRQSAEVENNLSSVERLHWYATSLEEEAPAEIESTKPAPNWPQDGAIELKNVVMSYRPELPPVLRNLSISIRPGEKIGVVGRTGAGKSSIMLTLFRIVELSSGSITIDGVDISTLGLKQLRDRLAIIPQEALLFNGKCIRTIRSNLDPFNQYEDVILWSALKRAWLVERGEGHEGGRFTLDTVIEDEGLNMSVGERSLVSLARALVKDAKIVVLDEATASVDYETDSKIQTTIATEFKDKTLLCIAHRINTIISYDRVLVMEKGQVNAFDTPANLFESGGIFHSLCVQSGISLDDIQKSRLAR
ncbi:ABC transporter [Meredithblackwellia eburnea MCA 4105]